MRWYTTELLKYDLQIKPCFPELAITEQEAILAVLRYLDEEAKRWMLAVAWYNFESGCVDARSAVL